MKNVVSRLIIQASVTVFKMNQLVIITEENIIVLYPIEICSRICGKLIAQRLKRFFFPNFIAFVTIFHVI